MADGRRVVQVSVTLADDVQIPSVRAYMVLSALAELGETLVCIPTPDDIEGFSGHRDRRLDGLRARRPSWPPWPAPSRTSPRSRSSRPSPTARSTSDEIVAAVDAGRTGARRQGRRAAAARPGRPGKGSSTVRVDAERLDQLMHFMGELVAAPHAGRGARRPRRRAGPLAGDAEPDPHLARPPGDGHAGPDDPGRGRVPALPAPRPRPLDQARQARRAASSSARTPSSTAPWSTRSATRSCT